MLARRITSGHHKLYRSAGAGDYDNHGFIACHCKMRGATRFCVDRTHWQDLQRGLVKCRAISEAPASLENSADAVSRMMVGCDLRMRIDLQKLRIRPRL